MGTPSGGRVGGLMQPQLPHLQPNSQSWGSQNSGISVPNFNLPSLYGEDGILGKEDPLAGGIPMITAPTLGNLPDFNNVRANLDKQQAAQTAAFQEEMTRMAEPERLRRQEMISQRGLTASGFGEQLHRFGEEDLQSQVRQGLEGIAANRFAAEADLERQINDQQFQAAIQVGDWQQAAAIENKNTLLAVKEMDLNTIDIMNNLRGTEAEIWINTERLKIDSKRQELEQMGVYNEQMQMAFTDYANRTAACGEENQTDGDSYRICRTLAANDISRAYGDIFGQAGIPNPFQVDESVEDYRQYESEDEIEQRRRNELQQERYQQYSFPNPYMGW